MEKKIKKLRITFLAILLFITVMLLSTSTYAWFTSNRVVTVNTINVHVAASGGLEISTDGQDWKSIIQPDDITGVHNTTYPSSVNQIPYELKPVSTGKEIDNSTGFLKMFYGEATNNTDGDYVLMSQRSIEKEGNGTESDGLFVAFDLFLKVTGEQDIYLSNKSQVTYAGEKNTGIVNATRIAFIDEGTLPDGTDLRQIQALRSGINSTTYIWEPNYDVHTPASVQNAYNTYGIATTTTNAQRIIYDGVISEIPSKDEVLLQKANSTYYPNLFKTVKVDYYTKENFVDYQKVFTLKNGITKIRVYMWIEGQDIDCENNASFGDVEFNVQFTVNPA